MLCARLLQLDLRVISGRAELGREGRPRQAEARHQRACHLPRPPHPALPSHARNSLGFDRTRSGYWGKN